MLGAIAILLGLTTFVVGRRIWMVGDMGWITRSSNQRESMVSASYIFLLFLLFEFVVLIAFAKTWQPAKRKKRRKAT